MTTNEQLEQLEIKMKAMTDSMMTMQALVTEQNKFLNKQGNEIEFLKSKLTSGSGMSKTSVTDKEQQKQMAKDMSETVKIVKDAVPILLSGSPGNYDKWMERLLEVFKLQHYIPIATFLEGVGLEEVTGIVKKEVDVETKASSASSTPTITSTTAPTISEHAAQTFFAFLTSKLDDGVGTVV